MIVKSMMVLHHSELVKSKHTAIILQSAFLRLVCKTTLLEWKRKQYPGKRTSLMTRSRKWMMNLVGSTQLKEAVLSIIIRSSSTATVSFARKKPIVNALITLMTHHFWRRSSRLYHAYQLTINWLSAFMKLELQFTQALCPLWEWTYRHPFH